MSHWINYGFVDQNLIVLCSCNDYIGFIEINLQLNGFINQLTSWRACKANISKQVGKYKGKTNHFLPHYGNLLSMMSWSHTVNGAISP
jgi:deoxyribodipyrimidine photolyase-like uncharacterized protein